MELGLTTIMMCLFFGTNAVLFSIFQVLKVYSKPLEETKKDRKEKELSKPFVGTMECYTNLTTELFRTGLIMAMTYICEKHWIFEHSTKEYSRDLFMFVLIVFFAYGMYTWKPITDLSLLGREQSEEWKGWMQFIFLLYHYFHAEEVYNSVRVMITCYVWMTGFGNFSFFYVKQDFGWLRVVQMLWRLNFSVLLLMWTHGNTWILYYICPMHTFYFLMVYAAMYVFSSVNHSKWGIRAKLMILAVIIFLVWDVNGGIFDFLFSWLGTDSVIGANNGSVWEYYFRTSLDHWSSFLGMIFALNFPLAEQFFVKAQGWPLYFAAALFFLVFLWWAVYIYTLEKFAYNLVHSYYAIIPLTAYIFFRNMTPTIRSGVSMSMHDLGKTTLETYLLQHHIWLTSNAKTLLTLTPGHPWINFALTTILFFTVSKELYRLTMSLRGMILPEDKGLALQNMLGSFAVLFVCFLLATLLHAFEATLLEVFIVCLGMSILALLLIQRFSRPSHDSSLSSALSQLSSRLSGVLSFLFACCILLQILISSFESPSLPSSSSSLSLPEGLTDTQKASLSQFKGSSPSCLSALSQGHWEPAKCSEPASSALSFSSSQLNKMAYCQTEKWVWDSPEVVASSSNTGSFLSLSPFPSDCPISKITPTKSKLLLKKKKVLFMGDSSVRYTYHQFLKMTDPSYSPSSSSQLKHANLYHSLPSTNTSFFFIWSPLVENITTSLQTLATSPSSLTFLSPIASSPAPLSSASLPFGSFDLLVAGAASWDALLTHSNLLLYQEHLFTLSSTLSSLSPRLLNNFHLNNNNMNGQYNGGLSVWLQPTLILDQKLNTPEKAQYMTEAVVASFRQTAATAEGLVRGRAGTGIGEGGAFQVLLDLTAASKGKESTSTDGVHYGEEVYSVAAQMVGNAFALHNPALYLKKTTSSPKQSPPKRTGSMSYPTYGFMMLLLTAVMLVTFDNFLGIGYLSLKVFGRSLDWEAAYLPLHKKLGLGGLGGGGGNGGGGGGDKERDAEKGGSSGGGGGGSKEERELLLSEREERETHK